MIKFSNPRIRAEFPDWPLGGNKRGLCVFHVERAKKGWRVGRTTTGKTKYHTYGGQACIVDGSDGRTYILQKAGFYDFITISRSDFMNAEKDKIGRDASVFEKDVEDHAELLALIVAGGSFAMKEDS